MGTENNFRLSKDAYVDVHGHTKDSDGRKEYSEREKQIKSHMEKTGGDVIAVITDHDIAQKKLSGNGYYTCSGVEVSTIEEETGFAAHILFYAHQFSDKVDEVFKKTREVKIENIMRNLDTLMHCNQGFQVSVSDCLQFFSSGGFNTENLNNFQLARYVISKPENRKIASKLVGVDIEENLKGCVNFYVNFLRRNGQFHKYGFSDDNCNVGISPEELSELAKEEGGRLSFAHPQITCRRGIDQFEEVFDRYNKRYQINAIEAPKSESATPDWIDSIIAKIATIDNGLLTFGSDSHGHPDFNHAPFLSKNGYIPKNVRWEHAERFKNELCIDTPLSKIQ